MNKGLTLIETLTVLLLTSIVIVVMMGFFQTGYTVFNKGYREFVIKNDYDHFVSYFIKDFKRNITVKEITRGRLVLLIDEKDELIYEIIKDETGLKAFRQDKELKLKNINIIDCYFKSFDRNRKSNNNPLEIVLIKLFITYKGHKGVKHYDFELFEVKK